ncbi:MBL fold metallo-hydrolase [Massilia sp. H-1]|nr:MBL fold metallo-hydrolase [Massilia sp. H-1]
MLPRIRNRAAGRPSRNSSASSRRPASSRAKPVARKKIEARGQDPADGGSHGRCAGSDTQEGQKSKDVIPRLRIRMYRHGLGDCMLLRFRKEDGEGTYNVLIDCGLITVASEPQAKMQRVARDIAEACKDGKKARIDVVVMTHEHWDHVSGFHPAQAGPVFDEMDIGEVWYAWTEDPRNELGKRLRAERAEKVQALAHAVAAFGARPGMEARASELGAMLGFFGIELGAAAGAKIGRTRQAFDYLMNRQNVRTRYLEPGKAPRSLPGVPGLRVYTFGPPQDEGMIKRSAPTKKGREVYELSAEQRLANNIGAAFERMAAGAGPDTSGDDCPFDPILRRQVDPSNQRYTRNLGALIDNVWNEPGQDWRKIEMDWTQAAETLALNLDSHTNNTCLVLAFEFTDTGEVMLFPADAQVGNWMSWQDLRWNVKTATGTQEITAPDLISRTVFYKVGHHGSHNATLRTLGLEQMTSEELVAFIPVSKEEAQKNRWMGMPFNPLVKRLGEKTYGRLLVADEPKPGEHQLGKLSKAALKRFDKSVTTPAPSEDDPDGKLWFELGFD